MVTSKVSRPNVGPCPFCQQGQLSLAACGSCHAIVALCDECELLWADVRAVCADPQTHSSGTYPTCPACDTEIARWYWLTPEQVTKAGLHDCLVTPRQ